MKHLVACAVAAVLMVPSVNEAQVYVKGGVGYALSLGGMQIDRNRTESATGDDFEYKYGSFGAGFELGGAVGFDVAQSVAAELGIWYNLGPSNEVKDVRLNPAQNRTTTYKSSLFGFSPAFVLSGEVSRMKVYARFGFVLGFASFEVEEVRPTVVTKDKFSGGMLLGFVGGLGATFPLGGNLSFFGELSMQGGAWSPTKDEQTSAATTTTITLKDSFNSNEQFVSAQPSIPFGNIGVRAGVKVRL